MELVGRGGMGEVYKALDVVLRRFAALKVLLDPAADQDERVHRLLREARVASALNHPNIVTIYDAGSVAIARGGTVHYIAMEFVDGATLRETLHTASLDDLHSIFIQIADALAKAHEAGVVHRDLKPENVLVRSDGVAKIVDFGLAKSFAGAAEAQFETTRGVLLGTFAYMSPEQIGARRVDGRSDMFSFGSMLYEALAGAPPFLGDSALETLQRIAHDPVRWSGGTADALREIIERCLAKNPDDRYPAMSEVATALRESRGVLNVGRMPPRKPVSELSASAQEVISVAAVIGMTVTLGELRDLVEDEDILDDALDELTAAGVLAEHNTRRGTFLFASASIRESAYARIPRRRRKAIHAACASQCERLLGGRPATVEMLLHFHAAGVAGKVIEHGLPLLRDLVEHARPAEAIQVADLILDLAREDRAMTLEATELMARARAQLGDFDRALAAIDGIRLLFESSPDALARLSRTAAHVAWEARRVDIAERWIRRGLSVAEQVTDEQAVRDMLALATAIATVTGDTVAADQYALRLEHEGDRPMVKDGMRSGRIVVPSVVALPDLDPALNDVAWRGEILAPIFETLTRVAAGGRIVPWLAEFEVKRDATAFRFRLRDGVRFHDGRPVTSQDVAFTYARVLREKRNASRWLLAPIVGSGAVADGTADVLEGFRCHSEREFTIALDSPVAAFPGIASFHGTGIVPSGTGPSTGTGKEACLGTGPYRVVRFEPGRRLELEANPYYWREGLPRTGRLAFVMGLTSSEIAERFRARELSLARYLSDDDFWSLRRDAELRAQYAESPHLSTYFLVVNRHRGPFADPVLRREALGIDMDAVLRGSRLPVIHRAHTLAPPGLIGHIRSPRPAPRRSTTAAFRQIPVRLGVLATILVHYRPIIERLAEALATHGFVVEIVPIDQAIRTSATMASFDLVVGRWYADYPDAGSFVDSLLLAQRGIYGRLVGDQKLDEIINRSRAETDSRLRRDDYAEIEEILQRDSVLLPLFHENAYCFAQREVGGFELNLSDPGLLYEQLWL